jgi:hypothetical protein
VRLSVLAGLALAAIQPQPWFAAMTGYDTLGKAIEGGFYLIMRWAAGAAHLGDLADTSSMIRTVANVVLTALFKMGEVQVFPAGTSLWKAMTNVTGLMVGLLMWFMCVVAYVIAGALVLGEAVAADLTIQIALAFAPLLVPWVLFAPLRFLFDAWLKTLLVGGVGFVIAILFCSGMAQFAASATQAMAQLPAESFINAQLIATFSPILIGSILMILMAGKVMSFANSLLSGAGMSGLSLGDFKNALTGTGAGVSGAGRAGRATFNAASKGVGAVAAGINSGRGLISARQLAKTHGARASAAHAANSGKAPSAAQSSLAARHGNRAYSAARFAGLGHAAALTATSKAVAASLLNVPATSAQQSHNSLAPGASAREHLRDKAERFKAARKR